MAGHRRVRPRRPSLGAIALIVACGCAHAGGARAGRDEAARAAIAAANAEFAQALVRGDARAMSALFSQDGQIIPTSKRGFVSGRAEIESYNAARLRQLRYIDAAITTAHLEISGDLAWEMGTSRVTVQQGEAKPVTVTGRYLAVWRREADGRWRIRAELPITDPAP